MDPLFAAKAAVFARREYGMRSITHVLAGHLAKHSAGQEWAKEFYNQIIRRPDDMLEITAYYKAKGGNNLPNAMKKGFARAFDKFDGCTCMPCNASKWVNGGRENDASR